MDPYISSFQNESLDLKGSIPLFPLPNLVLMPGEPMPLHIFEERYKIMMDKSLAGNRLLLLGHQKVESSDQKITKDSIYPIAGIGRIVMDEQLEDGRFNLILLGIQRVRIEKITTHFPYPKAEVSLIPDILADLKISSTTISELESDILQLAQQVYQLAGDDYFSESLAPKLLENLAPGMMSLSAICDLIATLIIFSAQEKQMILNSINVIERAEKLIFLLQFYLRSAQITNPHLKKQIH